MTYTLTYARVVIFKREIEVPDDSDDPEEEAFRIAGELEDDGNLGIREVTPEEGSWVKDVHDYDVIWEVEPR